MLEIDQLHTGYGDKRVLHGVSLSVGNGEVVTLLGRNGAGKNDDAEGGDALVARHGWRHSFRRRVDRALQDV